MTKEELAKQIDRWLKQRETIKPFIDRMVKLNVRREELLHDMFQSTHPRRVRPTSVFNT